jgi:Ca-activated chloride channel family protein
MRWRYGKFVPEDFGIDAEDLMRALGDFFLQSGFESQFWQEWDPNSWDEYLRAIEQALESGQLFPDDQREQLMQQWGGMTPEQRQQLLEKLGRKLMEEGYVSAQGGDGQRSPSMQITDRSLDFLGFKAFKELLGSLGRSSFGAHDTRDLATGVDASGGAKPYEFGDTLNLDASQTLFSALRREGLQMPLEIGYQDLHVHQSEYQSSCATVLMLDCSHSMILYGEDRFTPAKRVALALAHLIRTQYPGDSLRFVLFHDTAEETRLGELARLQVGPHYTNTRDGLILAQRLLAQEKKDMKQIIMITDGKPSALTLDDGRIYKNAFGLDPLVLARTFEEVNRCKRQGIMINTFMLANDFALVNFVRKVTEICRGKAYFATPYNLGSYLMMDYMTRKTRTVH